MSVETKPLDIAAIRARADAASPGPWLDGDAWLVAGVGFRNGPGRCAYCHLGPPAWSGKRDINGEIMQAHRHRAPDPWGSGHIISSADGGTVAGMYDYEKGGIVDPADQEFIRHARTDVPALLAEVERLRQLLGQTTAALNVALHHAVNEPNWHDMPDAEISRTELDGCREALRQAVAELHPQAPTTPKPESAALIAAVDKYTEGSGR